jgi:hypothetical protein
MYGRTCIIPIPNTPYSTSWLDLFIRVLGVGCHQYSVVLVGLLGGVRLDAYLYGRPRYKYGTISPSLTY